MVIVEVIFKVYSGNLGVTVLMIFVVIVGVVFGARFIHICFVISSKLFPGKEKRLYEIF